MAALMLVGGTILASTGGCQQPQQKQQQDADIFGPFDVLGLMLKGTPGPSQAEPFVALLVQVRKELRAAKQWALADSIRDRLTKSVLQE